MIGKSVDLGDVCEVVRGGSPRPIIEYITTDEEGVNWLKIGDVNECDKYFRHANEKIKPSGIPKTREVVAGDLILSNSMSFGRAFITLIDGYIHDGWLRLRPNEEVLDRNYLYYFLISNFAQNQFKAIATGSVVNNLKTETVKAIKIILPPLEIQKKIVGYLDVIDEKIELNNAINNNLLEQVLAIYRHDFIETTNKLRQICRADDYFDISIGKTPPRKEQHCFSNSFKDIAWVSIADMGSCGLYISDSSEKLTREAINQYNVKIVPDNTVLLSFKLTVGRIAITNGIMTTNEAIAHFKTNKKEINEYLYCYLKCFNYQTMGSTSSIAIAVNSKIIKEMPFIVPTNKELIEFHNLTSPIFEMIKANQSEIKDLVELRNTLLPKLLTGELDLSNTKI